MIVHWPQAGCDSSREKNAQPPQVFAASGDGLA
jgi:hypothetical protein